MSGKGKDFTGQKIGMVSVTGSICSPGICRRWVCNCDCGSVAMLTSHALTHSIVASCGCHRKSGIPYTSHGLSRHRTYFLYGGMLRRVKREAYVRNGITVCERWLRGFESFFEDMGHPPTEKHTLDRTDNSKGYSPDNCRWATKKQQARNRTDSLFVEFEGQRRNVSELAELFKISYDVVRCRIRVGVPVLEALTRPVRIHKKRKIRNAE